jgi:hypothetical protein
MKVPFKAPAALLDELGISEPSAINIEAIAQYCGATILYDRLGGCEARILGVDGRAIITVSSDAPRPRQRFSAAHELGHWMRDRGKIAFACTEDSLIREWVDDNPERRANRYAADLLLPRRMFEAFVGRMPPTFASARALARSFETSTTSTAIRVVELGSYPSMMVCSERSGRKWFTRSPLVPSSLWPRARPGKDSVAAKLLAGSRDANGPEEVDADDWIDHPSSPDYTLIEDSVRVGTGAILTMLWWKDERQILDIARDHEDEAEMPLSGQLTFKPRRR